MKYNNLNKKKNCKLWKGTGNIKSALDIWKYAY